MIRSLILSAMLASSVLAQSTQPAQRRIPASGDDAAAALKGSPRHGEWMDVPIPGSDTRLHTWVVYPERKDKAPVVLVIHEIFGMTDWVRGVADQLAAEGFIAVAPDLLSGKGEGGGGTDSFKEGDVRAAIQKLSDDEVAQRLDAARDWAIAQPAANDKTASIGFCWGGTKSFAYTVHQPKLNAAVVYYGAPPKEKDAMPKIKCPVLGLYGGKDARISATVPDTEKLSKEANVQYSPHIYEGAGHGFLRQQSGMDGANQKAAEQAWAETVPFLKKNLEPAQ